MAALSIVLGMLMITMVLVMAILLKVVPILLLPILLYPYPHLHQLPHLHLLKPSAWCRDAFYMRIECILYVPRIVSGRGTKKQDVSGRGTKKQ